jgi:hypothetical protein
MMMLMVTIVTASGSTVREVLQFLYIRRPGCPRFGFSFGAAGC